MHINLPPKMEKYLQSKVNAGLYSNASEVVRDAIRRMSEEDRKLKAWNAAVKKGEDQIARGEYMVYTPEVFKAIVKKAKANAKKGKKPDPDVVPPEGFDFFDEGA